MVQVIQSQDHFDIGKLLSVIYPTQQGILCLHLFREAAVGLEICPHLETRPETRPVVALPSLVSPADAASPPSRQRGVLQVHLYAVGAVFAWKLKSLGEVAVQRALHAPQIAPKSRRSSQAARILSLLSSRSMAMRPSPAAPKVHETHRCRYE